MIWGVHISRDYGVALALAGILLIVPVCAAAERLSDAQVDRVIKEPNNRAIIEEFLTQELRHVNEYAAKPLLKRYPSLIFFINQAERGPIKNLIFLEDQVHKLRDAQARIDSVPYVLVFAPAEKKIILSLKESADDIVLRGIPLIKRDFYRVLVAARELADEKRKHPLELMPDPAFRNVVYRRAQPVPKKLDEELAELSKGELRSFRLGWDLERVTLTRLWLVINDNQLPRPEAYAAFRKRRSEYWKKRMSEIYGIGRAARSGSGNNSPLR